jgi:hypothetical protein
MQSHFSVGAVQLSSVGVQQQVQQIVNKKIALIGREDYSKSSRLALRKTQLH